MAKKLKTYQTSLGFFEQAIAAPSMKAALEAWGADSNLFHQGAARESTDPDLVALEAGPLVVRRVAEVVRDVHGPECTGRVPRVPPRGSEAAADVALKNAAGSGCAGRIPELEHGRPRR